MKKIRIVFGFEHWSDIWGDNDKETEKLRQEIYDQMENKKFKTFHIKDVLYVKSQIKLIEIVEE